MKKLLTIILAIAVIFQLSACKPKSDKTTLNNEAKSATKMTEDKNAQVYQLLDFNDKQEGEFAARGLIAAPDSLVIKDDNGNTVWS